MRHRFLIVVLSLCLLAAPAGLATEAVSPAPEPQAEAAVSEPVVPPEPISEEVSESLAAAVEEYVQKLVDADASKKTRARFTREFKRSDAGYVTTLLVDVAEQDMLRTDRQQLVVSGDPGSWSVEAVGEPTSMRLLVRPSFGNEQFYKFDRFEFDREGLKIVADNGELYTTLSRGLPSGFVLAAENLTYSYEPPERSSFDNVHDAVVAVDEDDFDFTPEHLLVNCAPASCPTLLNLAEGMTSIEKAQAGELLTELYEDYAKERDERYEEDPFADFRLPYSFDRQFYEIGVKRKGGKDHWATLKYDTWEAWEITFSVTGYGSVYGYVSEQTHDKQISEYRLERKDDVFRRNYEVYGLSGDVDLALIDSESLEADLTYVMRAKRDLSTIEFWVRTTEEGGSLEQIGRRASQMIVEAIQDETGQDLTWVPTGGASGVVVLGKTVPAGERLTIRVKFQHLKSIHAYNHTYSYVDRFGWIPFITFGDMIPQFEMTIRVPKGYKTLGIGTKVDEKETEEVNETRWVAYSPVVFPTVIFGKYHVVESDVKAFKLDGTPIPVTMHVDKVGMGEREIRIKQMKELANQAAESLNFFAEIYGLDYPYGRLDLVNDPIGYIGPLYGQSPSSIVYLGWATFRGTGTLATFIDRADSSRVSRALNSLVAHEVAHQWWGSRVVNANGRNYWFVESLAEFSSALYVEAKWGKDEYAKQVAGWRNTVLSTDNLGSVQNASALYAGDDLQGYLAAVYNRGPYAFHTMRSMFGDARMRNFLRQLAKDLGGREIVTRDIEHVASKAFGGDMEWFFDQWIRGTGIPEYTFEYTTRQTEDGMYLVEGEVTQKIVTGKDRHVLDGVYYKAILPIWIEMRRGESKQKIAIDGPSAQFRFKVPDKPKRVTLNKYGEILAHDIRTK